MPGCVFVGELALAQAQKDREDTEMKVLDWAKNLKIDSD